VNDDVVHDRVVNNGVMHDSCVMSVVLRGVLGRLTR
jgi:hypothetical protein